MTDISKYKAVIFDVDGTLYNQRLLRRAIVRRFAAVYWIKWFAGVRAGRVLRVYRNAHEEMRGLPYSAEAHLKLAAEKSKASDSYVRETVARWMEDEPLELLSPCVYSGVIELLQGLADRGIVCGAFSDYPAINKLKAMKLDRFFKTVSCADEAGRLKPDPRGLLDVLKRLGAEPEAAVYIGDRQIDSDAAIQAGMKAELIHGADSYSELLRSFSSGSKS
jgi:HAD superfamily hydrolase (TIGR01509 family)